MKTYHFPWFCFLLAAVVSGCADLKSDLPSAVAPGVKAHGTDWIDTSSAGFHGKVVSTAHGDVAECLKCHGLNYQGGVSGVSCVACHQAKGATLHGRGWLDSSSPNFHGNAVRTAHWDMRPCRTCHGISYDGGKVGVSCKDCHTGTGGPEGCATCHGSVNPAPPRDLGRNTARSARGVGAHQIHVAGSTISGAMFCDECHTTPGDIYTASHMDATAGAEVLFNGPVAHTVTNEPATIDYDPQLPSYTPSPSYDPATLKCSNVYCHGYFKNGNQTFAPVFTPTWNDTTVASGACGTCHGNVNAPLDTLGTRYVPRTTAQGGSHPNVAALGIRCVVCHADVIDANFRIINPLKHINGKLNVFDEERDF